MSDRQTYEITAYDARGRRGLRTYMKAANLIDARRNGRTLLQTLGQRGRFRTSVEIYNPLTDPEMRGFIAPMPTAIDKAA